LAKGRPFRISDVERLTVVQDQIIKLRRLAAETLACELSGRLYALADEIEQRAREADRLLCSPK
jgi:hypothetical protein